MSDPDTFKILIATDNHLGYAEKDPIRGNDSFVTFEEILCHARELRVDLILLGGDLFHESKPSRSTMHTCMRLLRHYCLGDSPIRFQVVSDSASPEPTDAPLVNYEDPNFNISIPVFSIHGNHDDPTGLGYLCSLDLLKEVRLVNYFGKYLDLDQVSLSPLLLKKGSTKLALYGLGWIRDERLHRLFRAKKIKMFRPREDIDDWFNLMVLHQNRARHSDTNYIPEDFLPSFLDLVIWGHEHECRLDPEATAQDFFISQPGSSVATSLSRGEVAQKSVGLLEVKGRELRMTKIPLETVRQFYLEDIVLSDTPLNLCGNKPSEKVRQYCEEKVNELLEKAVSEHSGNEKQPKEPLVRLRVEYDDANQTFPPHRFAQEFLNKVANPKDILVFRRCRKDKERNYDDDDEEDAEEKAARLARQLEDFDISHYNAINIVENYFSQADYKRRMMLLTNKGMGNATKEFVVKEEKHAIREIVKFQLKRTQKFLKERDVPEDNFEDEVESFKSDKEKSKEEVAEAEKLISETRQGNAQDSDDSNKMNSDVEADMDSDNESAPTRGRGRGRARARGGRARGTRGSRASTSTQASSRRGRGRAAANTNTLSKFLSTSRKEVVVLDSDEDDISFRSTASSSSRKATVGSKKRRFAYDEDDDDDF